MRVIINWKQLDNPCIVRIVIVEVVRERKVKGKGNWKLYPLLFIWVV
jgi:hypothetical protein